MDLYITNLIFLLLFTILPIHSQNANGEGEGGSVKLRLKNNDKERLSAEEELRLHLLKVIEHYKKENPIGVPEHLEGEIPDPMPLPNLQDQRSGVKMSFTNLRLYGLRKFKIEHVRTDLSALKVSAGVSFFELQIKGNYSMSTWLSKSKGEFNVTIKKIWSEAEAHLTVSEEGFLQANQIAFDLKFEEMQMNFKNLGLLGNLLQGIINSVGNFIFESIKPMILEEVEKNAIGILNREARSLPQQFPNSINPLDMAIASARNLIRERGYDPFTLPDQSFESWPKLDLTEGVLNGLATIHRTGPILLTFERNTIQITLHLGAENLKGKYNWRLGLNDFFSRKGVMMFGVEYIRAEVKVEQPANLDLPPVVKKIDIDLGTIAVYSDGAGTLDYVIEALFNIIPNIFRNHIVDSLESTVSFAIENELRKLRVEEMVEQNL